VSEAPPIGLFEAIYSTRALRRLRPDPVPDETLFQLLDATIRAPSGQNAQDWRFLIITDPAIKQKMQSWAEEGWTRYQARFAEDATQIDQLPRTQRLSLKSVAYLAHHLGEAPVVIAVCGLRGRHSTPGGSTFPAVQNLLLAARALGLGASIFNLPRTHVARANRSARHAGGQSGVLSSPARLPAGQPRPGTAKASQARRVLEPVAAAVGLRTAAARRRLAGNVARPSRP